MKYKRTLYILLICIISIVTGCNMSASVEKLLYDKYNEEFNITEDHYHFELGANTFMASPKRYPQLKFYGRYTSDGGLLDYYKETLRQWQSEQFVKSIYQKEHPKNYVNCAFTPFMQHEYGTRILEMDEVLQMDTVKIKIENYVYLFEGITAENKEKMLNEVLTLIDHYNQYPNKEIFICIYFWDKSFLINRNFDSLNFTLNVVLEKDDNADNTTNKNKYIKHLLPIKFKTPSKTKFTSDILFSAVIPYDTTTAGGGEAIRFE